MRWRKYGLKAETKAEVRVEGKMKADFGLKWRGNLRALMGRLDVLGHKSDVDVLGRNRTERDTLKDAIGRCCIFWTAVDASLAIHARRGTSNHENECSRNCPKP